MAEIQKEKNKSSYSKDLKILLDSLEKEPELEKQIFEIFDYQLKNGVDENTIKNLKDSLGIYLPKNAVNYLLFILTYNEIGEIESIKKRIHDRDISRNFDFFKKLLSIYGSQCEKSFNINHFPNDWENCRFSLLHDTTDMTWIVHVDLVKYNGEKFYLTMPANSALNFAAMINKQLGQIPEKDVNKSIIKYYFRDSKEFLLKFYKSEK
jgi:uncharacterized ubiquitin-like protein YukD